MEGKPGLIWSVLSACNSVSWSVVAGTPPRHQRGVTEQPPASEGEGRPHLCSCHAHWNEFKQVTPDNNCIVLK